ncbi:F-actin-capping protein subunit alpha-1-like [Zophobas morio]|jgi:capping protein alpha|uniref:F-actin-capping protein subunit alpha-1-like n=1 Tax=Zophobas morio TaxID=2755281 RepID=UPI0030827E99
MAISKSEKVQYASEFILAAPPGELKEVLNDVRVLLNDDTLLKDYVLPRLFTYHQEQFTPVDLPNQNQTLITSHGWLESKDYLDPRSAQYFTFDPLSQKASDLRPIKLDQDNEDLRKKVEALVDEHVKDIYSTGVSAVYTSADCIIVCIESHKYNPNNYWNGSWLSEYIWKFKSGEVSGKLKIQVHYYEDGNVQLLSHKDVEGKATTPEDFLKFLQSSELEYQQGVNENYLQMSDTTFKALRRTMPPTRTLLDWDKIGSYKVGKAMGSIFQKRGD